jgi:hypothetical protein
MSETPETYAESVEKAIKNIRIADHMLYVTYPVIKDKRLLLKALDQTYDSIICIINAVLQYDYLFKRIQIYKDAQANFQTFLEKCARRYNITPEESKEITNIIAVMNSHKKSPIEFQRKDRIIIMSDNLKTTSIDYENLKKYLTLAKSLVTKIRAVMKI